MRYLDACVPIDNIIGNPAPGWDENDEWCFSELLRVEVRRTFHRMHDARLLRDETYSEAIRAIQDLERSSLVIPVTPAVLELASGHFPSPIRTLDAIHLASAMILREQRYPDLVFATHDRRLGNAAALFGFNVEGVG